MADQINETGLETIGAGIFDFSLHHFFYGADAAVETTILGPDVDIVQHDQQLDNAREHINRTDNWVRSLRPRIVEAVSALEEAAAHEACSTCVANRRARFCCSETTKIGNDCERASVLIAGHDIRKLVDRVRLLEEYVVARELERATPLPTDIAISIAKYF